MQSCFHKILPNTASNTQVINSQIEEILAKTPLIRQALLKINITEQCKNITNSLLDLILIMILIFINNDIKFISSNCISKHRMAFKMFLSFSTHSNNKLANLFV